MTPDREGFVKILDRLNALATGHGGVIHAEPVRTIVRQLRGGLDALLAAERERCAKIAECSFQNLPLGEPLTKYLQGWRDASEVIADAIRWGDGG